MSYLAEMRRLSGLREQSEGSQNHATQIHALYEKFDKSIPKTVRKDQRKSAHIAHATAPMYHGVPDDVAKWGHEAHGEGLRAYGMEKSAKAKPHMKVQAHHEAEQAHLLAAHHLLNAGHSEAASLHQRAANYHRERKHLLQREHGAQHQFSAEAVERDPWAQSAWLAREGQGKPEMMAEFKALAGVGKSMTEMKIPYNEPNMPGTFSVKPPSKKDIEAVLKNKKNPDDEDPMTFTGVAYKVGGKIEDTEGAFAEESARAFALTRGATTRMKHLEAGEVHMALAEEAKKQGFVQLAEKHHTQGRLHMDKFAARVAGEMV